MSDWDTLYADKFFAPTPFAALLVPVAELSHKTELSPLTWVEDVVAGGSSYNQIVLPKNAAPVDPVYPVEEMDEDEFRAAVMAVPLNDYYGLLNLGKNNFDVDIELVKANFKKINLLCHPDKADPAHRKEAEKRFKKMQLAHDTLTDAQLKIEYDSGVDFDEDIPSAKQGTDSLESFLAVYGPVFERNSVYSSIKPVPRLGGVDATKEEVDAFYAFWFSFKSWREFTHGDTDRCGDSASREERRRSAAKNKKVRETLKKAEVARLRKLVTAANELDPRVKFFKKKAVEDAKAAKAAAYLAKNAGKDIAVVNSPSHEDIVIMDTTNVVEEEPAAVVPTTAAPVNHNIATSTTWSLDELSMLAKATQKFPIGTKDRAGKIAAMINVLHKGTELKRSDKETMQKLKEQTTLAEINANTAFVQFQKELTGKKDEAVKYNKPNAAVLVHGEDSKQTVVNNSVAVFIDDPSTWSTEEQKNLEKGLVSCGKGNWEDISKVVGSKTAMQCESRFKYLKDEIKRKKAAAK